MNNSMGHYGYASSCSEPRGLNPMNGSFYSGFGYNYPKQHPYSETLSAGRSSLPSRVSNQRRAAPPQPPSPPPYFVVRAHRNSNQQEPSYRSQENRMSRQSFPRPVSPIPRGPSQVLPHNGRSVSMSRFEPSLHPTYEEENFYNDMDQAENFDRAPNSRRYGSSQTRPSLGRSSFMEVSPERPHRHEGKSRFQYPNSEMRSFMAPRRGEPGDPDVEMDEWDARGSRHLFNRSFPTDDSANRALRRPESKPRFPFPSYDAKSFSTLGPENAMDIEEYGPRERRPSFGRPIYRDDSPIRSMPRHPEEKSRFQFPSHDMRPLTTPRRGSGGDLEEDGADMLQFGVNRSRRMHDMVPDHCLYQRRDDMPRYQLTSHDTKSFATPRRRGVNDVSPIQPNGFGAYRSPLPVMCTPKIDRSSMVEDDRRLPPLPAPLPSPRETLLLNGSPYPPGPIEKRTMPLYFLKKAKLAKKEPIRSIKGGRSQILRKLQSNRRKRSRRNHCDICERRFSEKSELTEHFKSESHKKNLSLFKETVAKIKEDEGDDVPVDEQSSDGKSIKIYCGLCKESFSARARYTEHLSFRRHKLNARIHQLFKDSRANRTELSTEDPLGSFCLYINSDTHTNLLGVKEDKNETPVKSKQNLFARKFLDLRHLLSQESGPPGEEYIEELGMTMSRDKRPFRCSLCNENLIGVDAMENHLHSLAHQELFKKNTDPNWIVQKTDSLSFFDVIFELWKACKDKYKKELKRIEKVGVGSSICVCGLELKSFDHYKKHFPKAFPEVTVPVDSDKFAAAEDARRVWSYRNTFRECINLLKLFKLPDDVILAKRENAMKIAKEGGSTNPVTVIPSSVTTSLSEAVTTTTTSTTTATSTTATTTTTTEEQVDTSE
ncbi:unnamed protein product [Heterobilharzia americana]|nr:unnamed protein product [Heterobilharzia americana]CAH8627828.1 unnamed protein product [Heterobilharzia americana]